MVNGKREGKEVELAVLERDGHFGVIRVILSGKGDFSTSYRR